MFAQFMNCGIFELGRDEYRPVEQGKVDGLWCGGERTRQTDKETDGQTERQLDRVSLIIYSSKIGKKLILIPATLIDVPIVLDSLAALLRETHGRAPALLTD